MDVRQRLSRSMMSSVGSGSLTVDRVEVVMAVSVQSRAS